MIEKNGAVWEGKEPSAGENAEREQMGQGKDLSAPERVHFLEQALEEKERQLSRLSDRLYCLEEIIDKVHEGVILTDQDCVITLFNPAKEQMEQMKASDVLGKISWEAYSHSNQEESEHQQVLDGGVAIENAYRPHAYVGETPVYIHYSTYPVKRDGKVIGVYTISRNESVLRELLYETIEHKRLLRREDLEESEWKKLAKGTHFSFADIVGASKQMKRLLKEAQTIAPLSTPVLITGETGTGKEVLAQSIHNLGRENKKFVAINCAAIPENLVESVLFGTVKGAYTGALDSVGLFREAEDGTLFLDEINSMSPTLQAKLLRALQEKSVRPVGGLKEYPIRCRLICASNEKPEDLLREKRLRNDLFYRIAGFCLAIPPLRERPEDLLDLTRLFIKKFNKEFYKHVERISPGLQEWILEGEWPGNTRELQNIVQNMMVRVSETSPELTVAELPDYARPAAWKKPEEELPKPDVQWEDTDINEILWKVQKTVIQRALESHEGNITQAAASLGIGRQNLMARMKRLGIAGKGKE